METKNKKEPIVAALLNLFTLGGGYLYIGQKTKGIVFLAGELVSGSIACCLFFLPTGLPEMGMTYVGCFISVLPLLFAGLIALGTAWDGYNLAQRVNDGQTLGDWEFFSSTKK